MALNKPLMDDGGFFIFTIITLPMPYKRIPISMTLRPKPLSSANLPFFHRTFDTTIIILRLLGYFLLCFKCKIDKRSNTYLTIHDELLSIINVMQI